LIIWNAVLYFNYIFPLLQNYIGKPAIGELIKAITKIHGGGAGAFTRQVEEGTFCIQRTGAWLWSAEKLSDHDSCE